jgi:hypothetical protein
MRHEKGSERNTLMSRQASRDRDHHLAYYGRNVNRETPFSKHG